MKLGLFAILFTSLTFAQNVDNFTTLKAGGIVPEDFRTLSSEKYETDYRSNNDESLDKDFFLSTRFFIDELLLSGKMLFNEPLSDYVSKVARYTLRREKETFKQLRFYVLKSTAVNAFSTDQGIIVFTTGLLAQLENEAQLAYIIAHEVSHFTEKHVRDSYIEKKSFSRGKGKYQRLSYESRINELSAYEKDNEFEADQKGIDIYLNSEYAVDEIFSSFEILLYSYLPFDDIKFDTAYFNTPELTIPGSFFPDTINQITAEEDYDDSKSSHPNLRKRIDAAFDYVEDKSTKGDLQFKISEKSFFEVRNLARFEIVNLLLANREYGKALYNIYLLRRDFPDNRFLDLSEIKAFYGLTKYKNANRYSEVTEKFKKIEGESYPLHYFLKQLSKAQLNVIALRYATDRVKKYPGDKIFVKYRDDLKKEIAIKNTFDYKLLKDSPFEEYVSEVKDIASTFDIQDSIAKVDESDLSKYEKIKLKKKLRALEGDTNSEDLESNKFHLFALYDLVQDGLIDELKEIKKSDEEEKELAEQEARNREKKRSAASEISKVVIVDPIYEAYNLKNKRNHTKSEDRKLNLANSYQKEYPKLNMDVDLLDSKNLNKEDADKYNRIGLVFQWLVEVLEHDDIDMISSTHDQMQEVSESYGTEHFLFTGIYAYKDRNQFSMAHFYGILLVYTAPLAIADLLIIHNYFDIVSFSINSETDNVEFVQASEVNLKGNKRVMDAYIYDVLYQLNQSQIPLN